MPSPIAHAAAGYAVYHLATYRRPERAAGLGRSGLVAALLLSQLPDLDFIPGLLLGDFDRFHNSITNSLFVGLAVALLVGIIAGRHNRATFFFWFWFALSCYELHVLMDTFTIGRGTMLLWPLSAERFEPPFKLFYGLHRSDGWLSIRHLWTVLSESLFALIVYKATTISRNHSQQNKNIEESGIL